MAAQRIAEPGVYRFFALIDGRPAFYVVDWNGIEHELRIVGEDEHEGEVIAELSDEMGPSPSRSGASPRRRPGRPPLFLL